MTEKEVKIEQLKSSDETEVLKVLAQAFEINSSIHAAQSRIPRIIRRLMNTLLGLFGQNIGMRAKLGLWGGFSNLLLYGIRLEGKLVCVAILKEAEKRSGRLPLLLTIIDFLISAIFWAGRMLRWQTAIEVDRIRREAPKHWKDHYIKLLSFGTLPVYQKQGFGCEMLRFICMMAESKGFAGIQLSTVRDKPAFHLYLQEGFSVEKDFNIASESTVLMRLTFLENPPRQQ